MVENEASLNALVLAAGFGTRLGEYGIDTPKGLIKMSDGETLLGKLLSDIRKQKEVEKICIITNAKFRDIYKEWLFNHGLSNMTEIFSNGVETPEKKNGAIGDLSLSIKHFRLDSKSLLVCPSDTYYDFDISDLLKFVKKNENEIVTIVRKVSGIIEISGRLGCAVLQGDNIISFIEKPADPPSLFAAIPFYYYPAEKLNLIEKYLKSGGNPDAPGNIISWLLENGETVKAFVVKGKTLDVGTMKDVEKLKSINK